jgi:hypothetical protein
MPAICVTALFVRYMPKVIVVDDSVDDSEMS